MQNNGVNWVFITKTVMKEL